jgi:hypothetical protein
MRFVRREQSIAVGGDHLSVMLMPLTSYPRTPSQSPAIAKASSLSNRF